MKPTPEVEGNLRGGGLKSDERRGVRGVGRPATRSLQLGKLLDE